MNKFTRVSLIIAGVLISVGFISICISSVLGISKIDIEEKLPISVNDIKQVVEESSVYDMTEATFDEVRGLSIESGAAIIRISYGDVEKVELHYEKTGKVRAWVEEAVLEVECNSKKGEELEIILPQNMQLHELQLEIGAGQVYVENIDFVELDADVGAGELFISVPDAEDAYDYDVSCGVGKIQIGNHTYAGIVDTEKHNGAQKEMDIDCGAGIVEISFAE